MRKILIMLLIIYRILQVYRALNLPYAGRRRMRFTPAGGAARRR
jgi:hypothetical protein